MLDIFKQKLATVGFDQKAAVMNVCDFHKMSP